jgi:hypothetical protein
MKTIDEIAIEAMKLFLDDYINPRRYIICDSVRANQARPFSDIANEIAEMSYTMARAMFNESTK